MGGRPAGDAVAAAAAITGDRFRDAAKRESRAWNRHSDAFILSNLRAGLEVGEQSVHFDYGGLRARHDFHDGRIVTSVEQVDDGGARQKGGRQNAGSRTAPPQTRSHDGTAPAEDENRGRGRDHEELASDVSPPDDSAARAAALRNAEVAATLRAKRRRNKAKQKERRAATSEVVAKFVPNAYGGEDAPMQKAECPLWGSGKTDLKMAFVKLTGEVTHRCASLAREKGLHTTEVPLQFGGKPYSLSVVSGTRAGQMSTTERSIDLLMLISDGLTDGRLTTLMRRWSKRGADRPDERSMDDDDDD